MPQQRLENILCAVVEEGAQQVHLVSDSTHSLLFHYEPARNVVLQTYKNTVFEDKAAAQLQQFHHHLVSKDPTFLTLYEHDASESLAKSKAFQRDIAQMLAMSGYDRNQSAHYLSVILAYVSFSCQSPVNYATISDVIRFAILLKSLQQNPEEVAVYIDSDITYKPASSAMAMADYFKTNARHFMADIKLFDAYERTSKTHDRYRVCNDFIAVCGNEGRQKLVALIRLMCERIAALADSVGLESGAHAEDVAIPAAMLEKKAQHFKNNRPQGGILQHLQVLKKEQGLSGRQLQLACLQAPYLRYALTMYLAGPLVVLDWDNTIFPAGNQLSGGVFNPAFLRILPDLTALQEQGALFSIVSVSDNPRHDLAWMCSNTQSLEAFEDAIGRQSHTDREVAIIDAMRL